MATDDEITPIIENEVFPDSREYEQSAINRENETLARVTPNVVNGGSEDDSQISTELTGCGASALCDPRRMPHRFIALILMCLLGFGSTFCYDNPGALQDNIKSDMGINTAQFANLYAWYSWPNVILCFIGGFLLDRYF